MNVSMEWATMASTVMLMTSIVTAALTVAAVYLAWRIRKIEETLGNIEVTVTRESRG